MNHFPDADGPIDMSAFWQALEELEEGTLALSQCEELTALLNRSPAARRAYLEYFQQSAVLRIEAAKLHELGQFPLVGKVVETHREIRRPVFAVAALVALIAFAVALFAVTRPQPAGLTAVVSQATKWDVDGVPQYSGNQPVNVGAGSTVGVLSGTVRLKTQSGELVVLQGPANVEVRSPRRTQLHQGWLWIDAAKSDEPFQVDAAGLQIRGDGARFGVHVSAEGAVEVHLVKGRVEAIEPKSGKLLSDVDRSGKAFAFTSQGEVVEIPLVSDPFAELPALIKLPANYRTTVLGQAPVSYWLLDESKGEILSNQIRDSSVGFFGHAVHLDQPGIGPDDGFRGFPIGNRSVYLDGSPDMAAVAGIDSPHGVRRKEGAVSFWMRRSPDQDMRRETLWLAGYGSDESRVPSQAILHTRLSASGRVVFEIENGDADVYLSSSRNIVDGRWHQVVASWGPSSVDLYVDGRLVGSDSEPRVLEEANLSGRFVRFGKPSMDLKQGMGAYTGWVDEIALWNRPLSQAEVESQFQSALGAARD